MSAQQRNERDQTEKEKYIHDVTKIGLSYCYSPHV